MSGLASHAWGSWAAKHDKTYLWIRNDLRKIRGTRTVTYGYDTKLRDGNCHRDAAEIARTFYRDLVRIEWGSETKLIFLAHSLGGIVVKDAVLQLYKRHPDVLDRVTAVLFFGTPNLGMDPHYLGEVVRTKDLIKSVIDDLEKSSTYLERLEEKFVKRWPKRIKCIWAYETVVTPVVVEVRNRLS